MSKYTQLTEAEAFFRALKSELSIQPLFHQLESRVKAHILVAFLGYALWVTLKHLLKRQPDVDHQSPNRHSPMTALALLSNLHSADIILPTTDGHEIRLRRITEPTPEQRSWLHHLGIVLPQRESFSCPACALANSNTRIDIRRICCELLAAITFWSSGSA